MEKRLNSMKRFWGMVLALALSATAAQAGGLMTNTNYHIAFDRMFARGTTFDIDAAYSNPAGLAWGHEGWQLSLNFQKPWQYRDIELNGKKYEGKASAPIVPALFASYKKDRWAVSTMIGIVGSGGFVEYKEGVPMFNVLLQSMLASNGIMPNHYTLNSEMKGKQYIYGGQLNFTYKILDCLSAAAGIRANYYDGYYRGHVIAADHPQLGEVAKLLLDVDQKGWGFTPLVSLAFHQGPLTLSARYEFRTKVNPKNDTNVLDAGLGTATIAAMMATDPQGAQAKLQALQAQLGAYTAPYQDGARTRYDMPALLSIAAGYGRQECEDGQRPPERTDARHARDSCRHRVRHQRQIYRELRRPAYRLRPERRLPAEHFVCLRQLLGGPGRCLEHQREGAPECQLLLHPLQRLQQAGRLRHRDL